MPTPTDPHQERPSTYILQDRAIDDELIRLEAQDQMAMASMGGVLPELADPGLLRDVLDIACGAGGWLIEVARTYPSIEHLVGIDISGKLITYATQQARKRQVSERVHFRVMDALYALELSNGSFDLVNLRGGMSFLRSWEWPQLLQEFRRISRPAGIIRVTESDILESNSPALNQLTEIFMRSLVQSGHTLTGDDQVYTSRGLASLLKRYNIQDVQEKKYALEYRGGTTQGQNFYEDMKLLFRTTLPFFQKWTRVPDNYEALYRQALTEIQQPDFRATWHAFTAWGEVRTGKVDVVSIQ